MLCEATFPAPPVTDSYRLHQWVERILKRPGTDTDRDYLWTRNRRDIVLRQIDPAVPLDWQEVIVPPAGTSVQFQLMAHVRIGSRRHSNLDEADNLAWIERVCLDSGLMLHDVKFDIVSIPIEKPGNIHALKVSRFCGAATSEYPDLLRAVLAKGLGNAKAWGVGMLQLTQ